MAKATVDDSRTLDAWEFARQGLLRPGRSGDITWRLDGLQTPTARIGWSATADALWLEYTTTRADGSTHDERYAVPLERPPRGTRGWPVYFHCPSCGARVQKLHLAPFARRFLCRTCGGLAYQSQQERTRRRRYAWEWGGAEESLPPLPQRLHRPLEHQERAEPPPLPRDPERPSTREPRARTPLARETAAAPRTQDAGVAPATDAAPSPATPTPASVDGPRPRRGRPRTKRPYTRRMPMPVPATPAGVGRAYCVKCRDRRELRHARPVTLANGRRALRGTCAACTTPIARILGTADGLPGNEHPNVRDGML